MMTQNVLAKAAWLCCLIACAGCGSGDAPKVHPVEGTVTWDDGKPISGGTLEFRAESGEAMYAEITDGKFELRSLGGGTSAAGGVEGTFQVTYTPRIDANDKGEQTGVGDSIPLTEKVTITAGSNKVAIKVPRPKKPSR